MTILSPSFPFFLPLSLPPRFPLCCFYLMYPKLALNSLVAKCALGVSDLPASTTQVQRLWARSTASSIMCYRDQIQGYM